MKTNLTPSQSQRLIELGVDPSKASEVKEFDDELSKWTHRGSPIFTLTDILSLLPQRIDTLILSIFGTGFDELTVESKEGWMASYVTEFMEAESKNTIFQAPELIDALFELLCWVLKNHPDKIKRPCTE